MSFLRHPKTTQEARSGCEPDTAQPKTRTDGELLLRDVVRRLQKRTGAARDATRAAIVSDVKGSDDPAGAIKVVLRALLESRVPGRLDDAVDILAACGEPVRDAVRSMLIDPDIVAFREEDDCWYVLMRSSGATEEEAERVLA
jgi:hypothetical protein